MELWRRALLLVAINVAAVHLVLWAPLALAVVYDLIRFGGLGPRGPATALILGLGALGAVGVALPLRALWRGGRAIGLALVLAGLLYAPVAVSGLVILADRPSLLPEAFEGAEAWVVVVFFVIGPFFGGSTALPVLLTALYAGALVLGGVLTSRSEGRRGAGDRARRATDAGTPVPTARVTGVDGGGDRR